MGKEKSRPSLQKRSTRHQQRQKKIPSNTPTAAIAPPDYQNIFSRNSPKAQRAPSRHAPPSRPSRPGIRIPSDVPTAVIAPPDYQNIFSKKSASGRGPSRDLPPRRQSRRVPSDTPTALIAPADYENIFSKSNPKTGPSRRRIPSDTPTAAIAPPDYENIFSREAVSRSRSVKKVPSDTPTAAIAPADYENIFSRSKQTSRGRTRTETSYEVARRKPSPPTEDEEAVASSKVSDLVARFTAAAARTYKVRKSAEDKDDDALGRAVRKRRK